MTESPASPEALVGELRWLSDLARRLVADAHQAEDLVQDTLLAALEPGGVRPRSPRAWLATVLRRQLSSERRSRAARERRERASARPEASPGGAAIVDELSRHRRLVELVDSLDEPYREVIVRRFLRGETPKAIAHAQEVPVKTVYTRIERALARLRTLLDRDHDGDRSVWLAALAPLAGRAEPGSWLTTGSLWMSSNAKLFVALSAVLLVGGTLTTLAIDRRPAAEVLEPPSPEGVELDRDTRVATLPAASPSPEERRAVGEPAPGAPAVEPPASSAPVVFVRGRVQDVEGTPIAGLQIVFFSGREGDYSASPSERTLGLADGSFELPLPDSPGRLDVESREFVAILRPQLEVTTGKAPEKEPVIVVAPRREYAGRVVDEEGQPVARARVTLALEGTFFLDLPGSGAPLHVLNPLDQTPTDEDGRFRFERAVHVEGARLGAARDGFEPAELELPLDSATDLTLVLERQERPGWLHGLVLDDRGRPVPEARVSAGWDSVRTDPEGRFQLEVMDFLVREDGHVLIRAAREGLGPVVEPFRPTSEGTGSGPEHPLVLELSSAPLAIRGRVVDEEGRPVAGAHVWSPDTTYFGNVSAERDGRMRSSIGTLEAIAIGQDLSGPPELTIGTDTAADGTFELSGVLDREYTILVLDPRTLALAEPRRIAGGTEDVVLRLEGGEARPVSGRVLSRGGIPLAGVQVHLGRTPEVGDLLHRSTESWSGCPMGPPGAGHTVLDPRAVTDHEGRFRTPPIHVAGSHLFLMGTPILLGELVSLDSAADPEELEIVVDAACQARIVIEGDPSVADGFAKVDEAGVIQPLFIEIEGLTISTGEVAIVDGRSDVVTLAEGRHLFSLRSHGEEVARREIEVAPGGITEVRF